MDFDVDIDLFSFANLVMKIKYLYAALYSEMNFVGLNSLHQNWHCPSLHRMKWTYYSLEHSGGVHLTFYKPVTFGLRYCDKFTKNMKHKCIICYLFFQKRLSANYERSHLSPFYSGKTRYGGALSQKSRLNSSAPNLVCLV